MKFKDHGTDTLVRVDQGGYRDTTDDLDHAPGLIGVERPVKLLSFLLILHNLVLGRNSEPLSVLIVRTNAPVGVVLDTSDVLSRLLEDRMHVRILQLLLLYVVWLRRSVEFFQLGAHHVIKRTDARREVLVGLDSLVFERTQAPHLLVLLVLAAADYFEDAPSHRRVVTAAVIVVAREPAHVHGKL